jgi:hypothetical protein
MTDSDERPEAWKPVPEIDGCTFSGYEASDKGRARSIDRVSRGRRYSGRDLSLRPDKDGYILTDFRCDDPERCPRGGKHTFSVHKVVLTTFDRPCPPGMEACHSRRGPSFNWWPEGVRWGTKPENEADKPEPSTAPEPTFPCRNAPTCGNLVVNEGRRCLDCVAGVGREAAGLLRAGTPLQEVAEHFGYTGGDWVYSLAVKHGGYEGSKAQARMQRPDHRPCTCAGCQPSPRQSRGVFARVVATLRARPAKAQP